MNAVVKFPPPAPQGLADSLGIEALEAIDTTDPTSLDLALLGPLQKQLAAMADMGDHLPPDQFEVARKLESVIASLMHEQQQRLDQLVAEIDIDFDKAVKAKQGIEDRWIDDERQFWGKNRILESKLYPSDAADPKRGDDGPITVHATRSRTLMCGARLCDLMLPANDLPFRVEAPDDPVAEDFAEALAAAQQPAPQAPQQPGQPPQAPAQPAAPDDGLLQSVADKLAAEKQARVFAMAKKAGFKRVFQKCLKDAARIGVGIFKGPHPEIERKRRSRGGDFEVIESPRAGVSYVDPWFFWYDMTPTLARSSCTFEAKLFSRREMVDFKAYPRVMGDVIDDLLTSKEDDKNACGVKGALRTAITKRNQYRETLDPLDDVWVVLETHRVMDPAKFEKATGTVWDHDEPPLVHIWSCAGRCIKWKVTPLERDYRVDYYSVTIMPADDTIFGYGYPYLGRGAQRVLDGSMSATLANAGASVAPMMLVSQGKVHPNRENWKVRGLNIFSVENGEGPLENFFASVEVDSNVEQNLKLLELGDKLMDQDTLFNQMQQGNFNGEEVPASGFVIAANIGSVFQKDIAANADEECFAPFAERLGWWDDMYSDDPIEGQFKYSGIASTQLISKDLALQHMGAFTQYSAQPQFAGMTDAYKTLTAFARNIDGLPEGIILDREQAMQNQQAMQQQAQQGDPNKAAEIAAKKAIALADIEDRQQARQEEAQLTREKIAGDRYIEELKFKTALVQAQAQAQIDMTKVNAEFQTATASDATDRFKAVLDAKVKVGQQQQAEQHKGDPHSKWD